MALAAIMLTPKDYPWLKAGRMFRASEITFELLVGSDNWRQYASFLELVAGLHNPSLGLGADVAVAIHGRPLQPIGT